MLKLAITFTLIDAAATYIWIRTGIAIEGNPLLASLIEVTSPGVTMLIRAIAGVSLLIALAHLSKQVPWAKHALTCITVILGLLCVFHAIGPFL